jgi:hypothetical protein
MRGARDLFETEPGLLDDRHGQLILADKGYRSREFEMFLSDHDATSIQPAITGDTSIRPAVTGETSRPGARLLKPVRRIIDSINDTSNANSTSKATADGSGPGSPPESSTPPRCHHSNPAQRADWRTASPAPSSPTTCDDPLELII